jgi:hypothetical protein
MLVVFAWSFLFVSSSESRNLEVNGLNVTVILRFYQYFFDFRAKKLELELAIYADICRRSDLLLV